MRKVRLIQVRYYGPTNYKASKVVIKDMISNERVNVAFSYTHNTAWEEAEAYLNRIGIKIDSYSYPDEDNTRYLITSNLRTKIK